MTGKNLYYAFTNTQVINMINIKNSIYPDTHADIYIIDNGRISKELITRLNDKKIFDNIYYLKHHPYSNLRKSIRKLPEFIRKPLMFSFITLNYLHYQLTFHKQKSRKYNTMFLSGFWSDGVYFIKNYYKYNNHLKIYFVEEGTANYSYTITQLCYLFESLHPLACILWKITTGGNKESDIKFFNSIINGMYLYLPQNYQLETETALLTLPPITHSVDTQEIMINTISENIFERYRAHNVIYFMQDQSTDVNQYKVFLEYIQKITTTESLRTLIKQHPDFNVNQVPFGNIIENLPNTVIDCDDYLLEGIYAKVNLDNKILITRDSSSVMYPKYMFSKEPVVIFTYKLYQTYYSEKGDGLDTHMQNLAKTYTDHSKIYAPTSIKELEEILLTRINKNIIS